jgi:adenylate cyclase
MWSNLKKRLWKWRGVFIVVPATASILLGLRFAGLLQPLELAAYDLFFQLRPSEKTDEHIAIVEINESDIQKYNSPISDATLAKLIHLIKQQQPRVIGLDLYRDLPVPFEPGAGYQELIKIFESTPNLIGIRTVVGYRNGVAPPPVLEKLGRVAANDLPPDTDGKIRRTILSLKDNRGKTVQSLSVLLATEYLKTKNIKWEILDVKAKKYKLGKATFLPFEENDGGYVRAESGGYQILSNYRSFRNSFRTATLDDVLEGRIPKDFFRDRIVLIGNTTESSKDYLLTPFSGNILGNSLELASGVTIHANVVSQLIDSAVDGRPLLQVWTKPMECLWISIWALIGGLIYCRGYARLQNRSRLSLSLGTLTIALLGGGLVVGSYLAFLQGWWIPVVPSFLALFGSAIAITAYKARSADGMRQIFGRYLTDEVVANLLETPEGLNLGGERRKVTLLFSDLRGFSNLFEQIEPEQGVMAISLYLDVMTEVVTKYKGTINEFVGDGIFVMFGAPIQREDDTQRAVACAIAMQLGMSEVNTKLGTMQIPALQMGIGLHTGQVLVGNIGSQRRAKYTVMGSTVNLASRIESYTVGGQVLVSESILDEVKSIVRIDAQMRVKPKGFNEAIVMFDIGGVNDLVLPEDKETLVKLVQPISMQWNAIEGKHIMGKSHAGSLIELSANNAEILTDSVMEPLSNLKITLIDPEKERRIEHVYAKVVEVNLENTSHCWIRFTAVPPDVAEWLYDLRQTAMKTPASFEEDMST